MKYEDRKIVGVIATNVEASVALNVIGHLAIAIGKYSDSEIMGREKLIDSNGVEHLGISKFPFIITKVKSSKLKETIRKARQNPNILVADYPREMLETRTDDELAEALLKTNDDDIQYLGVVLYGPTADINEITGKFQLWKID